MTTFEEALFHLWPHGDDKIPGLRQAMVEAAPSVFLKYGINTKTAILQFMAQISHECGAGLDVEENLSYSAQRMCEVWPTRFRTPEEAAPYAHNPRALANKVYNGRMGNAIGTNDGFNYRGRGATQVTGREGYAKLGQKVGLDLLGSPSLVNEPEKFLECGAADFALCGCVFPAISDDIKTVTLKLNGGYVGLAQRQQWLSRWQAIGLVMELGDRPVENTEPAPRPAPVPTTTPVQPTGIWGIILAIFKAIFKGGK
jgi:putative chitinase